MEKSMKEKKREFYAMFLSIAVIANYIVCAARYEWYAKGSERIALIVAFVIGLAALAANALMYFGAEYDRLWRVALGMFIITYVAMLVIPMVFAPFAVAILMFFGSITLFALMSGIIFMVGLGLALLTEA